MWCMTPQDKISLDCGKPVIDGNSTGIFANGLDLFTVPSQADVASYLTLDIRIAQTLIAQILNPYADP